jgi:hypothetical protein
VPGSGFPNPEDEGYVMCRDCAGSGRSLTTLYRPHTAPFRLSVNLDTLQIDWFMHDAYLATHIHLERGPPRALPRAPRNTGYAPLLDLTQGRSDGPLVSITPCSTQAP